MQSYLGKKSWVAVLLYLLVLLMVIWYRYQVLSDFGFQYTDSDQAIMWLALKDYAHGIFHEPRFYGQDYNSMLEALLAVPLYASGFPVFVALPLVTSILTLLPFIVLSIFTFIKKSKLPALIILSIPLLLPVEYALITSLSRGFVTGIFVVGLGAITLFYPKAKISFFLAGFTSVIGFSLNANSVLIGIPLLLYLLLENRTNLKFYIYCGIGLLSASIIHFLVNYFYIVHPNYNLHKYFLTYSFKLLWSGIKDLDHFFNYVTPIFWKQGFIFPLLYLIAGIFLIIKRKFHFGIVSLSLTFLMVFVLGFSKVHDGTGSVFFSYSRMYLSLPLLIGISVSFLRFKNHIFQYFYLLIPAIFFMYKMNVLDKSIAENVSPSKKNMVTVEKVKKITHECKNLALLGNKYHVGLIVIVNHYYYDFFDYGCPACTDNFPKTLRPVYERRTWRLFEDEHRVYRNIFLVDLEKDWSKKFDFIQKIKESPYLYLIRHNELQTMKLLRKLHIPVRKYK